MNPRKLTRPLRLATLALSAVGAGYLGLRYDLESLPEGSCSPLVRFPSGSRLLIDTRPTGYGAGDALLFRGPGDRSGQLLMGRVTRVRPSTAQRSDVQAVWVETDNRDCPGPSSKDFDWVDVERVAGRILLAFPN